MMDGGSPLDKTRSAQDYGPRKKNRMIVELPPRPNYYIPRSGPPLQPIGLLPSDDSTAYIQDRIILPSPGLAKDGKPLPKQMTYLLGWTDLPAASMLVSAMEVLEYVSPLVLEQWEYNMELDLDKEKAKLQKEKQEGERGQSRVSRKRRGRPPAHSQIESAAIAEPEDEAKAKSRISKGAMTLSTPCKRNMTDDVGMWDEGVEGEEPDFPSAMLIEETAAVLAEEMGLDNEDGLDGDEVEYVPPKGESSNFSNTESTLGLDSRLGSISENDTPPLRSTPATVAHGSTARQAHNQSNQRASNGQPKITSFLSANKETYKRAPSQVNAVLAETPIPLPAYASSQPKSSESKAKPKPTPKASAKAIPVKPLPDPEEEWEIKRLEGMRIYEVEGKGIVRYFKVRWVGNWPSDQNPTWEPEEHLPPAAVRNWLKMSKKRQLRLESDKRGLSKKPALKNPDGSTYRSVSEAFMGGVEDETQSANETTIIRDEDEDVAMDLGLGNEKEQTEDELLVVADGAREQPSASKSGLFRRGLGLFSAFR